MEMQALQMPKIGEEDRFLSVKEGITIALKYSQY